MRRSDGTGATLSAASPSVTSLAPGAVGQNLAPHGPEILGPPPSTSDGTSVSILDAVPTSSNPHSKGISAR